MKLVSKNIEFTNSIFFFSENFVSYDSIMIPETGSIAPN